VPIADLVDRSGAVRLELSPRRILESYFGSLSGERSTLLERFRYLDLARKQAAGDIFLGWLRRPLGLEDLKPRDLYVRQLWDSKISTDISAMRPSDMALYARLCAWTLARGHARSGDSIAIASYRFLRCLRPRDRGFRRRLCRPERARPRRAR